MKKKLFAILTAAVLLATFFGAIHASAAGPELTAEEYAAMTKEDLVAKGGIVDPTKPTLEEFCWLVETFRFVDIDYEELSLVNWDNITNQALKDVKVKPNLTEFVGALLASPYPQARAYGYDNVSGFFGTTGELVDAAVKALESETDLYCLYHATRGLCNDMTARPEIADFIFRMADHENPEIRGQAALAIGNYWSIGVEGTVEKIIEMMRDEDQSVRKTAAYCAGNLDDEAVIPVLVEILNNPDEYKIHGDAIRGLANMWWNFPMHQYAHEAAYRATLDYYAKKPRTSDIPAWSGVSCFHQVNERKIEDWKKMADWFDPEEFYEVMADFILDPDASSLAKTTAMEAIYVHCPEKFADLGAALDASGDEKLKETYEMLKTKYGL